MTTSLAQRFLVAEALACSRNASESAGGLAESKNKSKDVFLTMSRRGRKRKIHFDEKTHFVSAKKITFFQQNRSSISSHLDKLKTIRCSTTTWMQNPAFPVKPPLAQPPFLQGGFPLGGRAWPRVGDPCHPKLISIVGAVGWFDVVPRLVVFKGLTLNKG